MKTRYGEECAGAFQPAALGATTAINGVSVRLVPAGHILGSAQIVLDWQGARAVVSGDYKRSPDPTCRPFELVPCDVFVTEATFALPVFRHEPAMDEIAKLLASLEAESERTHLVGAYSLGKCQRVIRLLRDAGYDKPIWLHGAMASLCALYQELGVDLGDIRLAANVAAKDMAGGVVMCPPSAIGDRWSRRFGDPVGAFASGWMRIRGRARQSGVELPLVISDHVDWPELITDHRGGRGRRSLGDARARGRASSIISRRAAQGARAGPRRPRRGGGRIAVRRFAALLDGLGYTQSRNRKIALLGRYFRAAPDPDRGWALAALTDGVPIRVALRRMIADLTGSFIDPVLYKLSRDYVGDTAETVALLWPDRRANRPSPSLDEVVADMQVGTLAERTEALGRILDALDPAGRWAAAETDRRRAARRRLRAPRPHRARVCLRPRRRRDRRDLARADPALSRSFRLARRPAKRSPIQARNPCSAR